LSFAQAGSSKQYQGSVINLSSKGILFTSNEKFDEGTQLDITLTPSNSTTAPMEAVGIVTRVSDNDVLFEIACTIEEIKS